MFAALLAVMISTSTAFGQTPAEVIDGAWASMMPTHVLPSHKNEVQVGIASVYSRKEFPAGRTASGIRLDDSKLTAASKTIRPFGTKARVTNIKNGRSIIVTITDDGPHIRGRIVDLTPAGARALDFDGLARVVVERIE